MENIKKGQIKQITLLIMFLAAIAFFVIANNETNNPPTLNVRDINVSVGEWAVIIVSAEDPDGDNITFYYADPFDEFGTWKPKKGDEGDYLFTMIASDGVNFVMENFSVNVIENLTNSNNTNSQETNSSISHSTEVVANNSNYNSSNSTQNNTNATSANINDSSDYVSKIGKVADGLGISHVVNNRKIIDDEYAWKYFNMNNNFSDLSFSAIDDGFPFEIELKAGYVNREVAGVEFDSERYIIDLLICVEYQKLCWFRINGIIFPRISDNAEYGPTEIVLDDTYKIKVLKINFDYCNEREICDKFYEAYNLVELEIQER